MLPDGTWEVTARVERFSEPSLLLSLSDGPAHGYDLADHLGDQIGERVDLGNLYRLLRRLEQEGIVASEWNTGTPGPSKRTYEMTESGSALLDAWALALGSTVSTVSTFLDTYKERH